MKKRQRAGLSAIPAMSAMVSAHAGPVGMEAPKPPPLLQSVERLPSPADFAKNMTDMAGIADIIVQSKSEVVANRSVRRKTGGRSKGTPNKVSRDIRAALRDLADGNAESVQGWLDRVAETDPGEAVRLWLALLRFVTPTLQAAAIADLTPKRNDKSILYSMSEQDLLEIITDTAAAPPMENPEDDEFTDPTQDIFDDELMQ